MEVGSALILRRTVVVTAFFSSAEVAAEAAAEEVEVVDGAEATDGAEVVDTTAGSDAFGLVGPVFGSSLGANSRSTSSFRSTSSCG